MYAKHENYVALKKINTQTRPGRGAMQRGGIEGSGSWNLAQPGARSALQRIWDMCMLLSTWTENSARWKITSLQVHWLEMLFYFYYFYFLTMKEKVLSHLQDFVGQKGMAGNSWWWGLTLQSRTSSLLPSLVFSRCLTLPGLSVFGLAFPLVPALSDVLWHSVV